MALSLKKRSPRSKEVLPSVRERVLALRKEGKKLERFMVVWIRECRMLDEHRAMIESLDQFGVRRRKAFDVSDVILETVEELFGGNDGNEST